jgi:hypothetical protein
MLGRRTEQERGGALVLRSLGEEGSRPIEGGQNMTNQTHRIKLPILSFLCGPCVLRDKKTKRTQSDWLQASHPECNEGSLCAKQTQIDRELRRMVILTLERSKGEGSQCGCFEQTNPIFKLSLLR